MHGLITHLPAGDLQIGDWRQRGAAGGHGDELHLADLTGLDGVVYGRIGGVVAAVEVHHHGDAGRAGGGGRVAGHLQGQVDGLLTEDRLACSGGALEQVGVSIGGRGDQDGINGRVGEDGVDVIGGGGIVAVGDFGGAGGINVEDAGEVDGGLGGKILGVDTADETGAQEGEGLHEDSFRGRPDSGGSGSAGVGGRAALPGG
nr:hypothetical protein [Actinomyces ruminis]